MMIDTHCHLSNDDYENLDFIIRNMDGYMISSGTNTKTNKEVLQLIDKYDNVFGTLGIHPEEISDIQEDDFLLIEKNLSNPKIVGIGEIGLDYYFNDTTKEYQKEVFIRQLDLAKKYNKPIVVHSRDSIQDTYDILKNYNLRGTIHCFSSSLEMAKEFIKLGYKIGVGGVVTFKNGKKIQEIVQNISIDDILLETDSPYLSPEPNRGKRNEPSNVYYTALKVAELCNNTIQEILDKTNQTAIKLFDLKI